MQQRLCSVRDTAMAKKEEAAHSYVLILLFHIETLLEAINTSASVNELLLAGIERMAF